MTDDRVDEPDDLEKAMTDYESLREATEGRLIEEQKQLEAKQHEKLCDEERKALVCFCLIFGVRARNQPHGIFDNQTTATFNYILSKRKIRFSFSLSFS